MSQNSERLSWSREEVDQRLQHIMRDIYRNMSECAVKYSEKNNFVDGANIAAFLKVSDAMLAQGYV
jgi:glutamate dehydrogenase (NADP+)